MPNDWSRDSKISLSALIVSVLSVFVSAVVTVFTSEIHDWFSLSEHTRVILGWIAPALGIIVSIVGIVYASKLPAQFNKRSHVLALVSSILLAMFAIGIVWYESGQSVPLVIIGSMNVGHDLMDGDRYRLHAMQPIWVDAQSNGGLNALFQVADSELSKSGKGKSLALLAMSSAGPCVLQKLIMGIQSDSYDCDPANPIPAGRTSGSYFLNIEVGDPPLTVLYREKTPHSSEINQKLNPQYSEQKGYYYVSCSSITRLYQGKHLDGIKRYVPPSSAGTRDVIQGACQQINWPKDEEELRKSFDQLGDEPFVELVSSPPWSDKEDKPIASSVLKQANVKAAVICPDSDCARAEPARAHHVVIFRLRFRDGQYEITNDLECRIAKSLSKKIQDCDHISEIAPMDSNSHIARLRADSPMSDPKFLMDQ
jgi:hypothetical protein